MVRYFPPSIYPTQTRELGLRVIPVPELDVERELNDFHS
jgi:hypothetical protein